MNHGITAGALEPGSSGRHGRVHRQVHLPRRRTAALEPGAARDGVGGLEMVDTENLRPHYARTLWAWSDALEARLDEARAVLERSQGAEAAGRVLRAYRLYLAGCAMSFERGWIALHQFLATRPDGKMSTGKHRGAQSPYPFNRDYIYR
jgi:cyclopropane-fatty-acyl-phospholipid synthase